MGFCMMFLLLSSAVNLCGVVMWKFPALQPPSVYCVPRARGYVQVIENGRAVMRLCIQPVECLPDADVVVLHKLMIEANEEHYLQKANKYLCTD